jgi:hypothetical protein
MTSASDETAAGTTHGAGGADSAFGSAVVGTTVVTRRLAVSLRFFVSRAKRDKEHLVLCRSVARVQTRLWPGRRRGQVALRLRS